MTERADGARGAAGAEILREVAAPFDTYRDVVRAEWIDHNRHLNVGYYLVVFDFATDAFFRWVGLGEAHRQACGVTTFCLEAHVTFHHEAREGDPLQFTTLLLGYDAKRLHYFHQMFHASDGYLIATNELMSLHVSRQTRRATPMAPAMLERLGRIKAAHDAVPRPAQIGRRMGLEARPQAR
jgi:acyl-CoA thioester hydrolase